VGVAGSRRCGGQGPFWGGLIGPNPTDRAKKGVKRSVLVEADGSPLSVVVSGANVPDLGYDNEPSRDALQERGYIAHIRRIGEEKKGEGGQRRYPARRWVVERTLGWLSKCRAILVRYEKKAANYLGLIKVACVLLWYRRQHRLSLLG